MSRWKLLSLALVASASVASGCASKGNADPVAQSAPTRDRNVLTAEEMEKAGGDALDVYQMITKLRPQFLRQRSTSINARDKTIAVFVGKTPYGSVDQLRSMRPSALREIRYLNASEATTLFGTGYALGALVLTLR